MSVDVEIMSENAVAAIPSTPLAGIDPVAIAAAEEAKALVQAAYTMALHRPRNVMTARQRILDACKRPGFAKKVEYEKPVGQGTVKGPSIRFAELALQQWGNIRVDTSTVFENDETRKIRVQVLDLETNACFGRVITINKTVERSTSKGREVLRQRTNSFGKPVYILKATEEELATKEAAAISKIVRNEGLRLIPEDIIEEAIEMAKSTNRGEFKKDPQAVIRKLCDSFAALRITPDELSDFLGYSIDKAKEEDIDSLRAIYAAINSGEARWSDYANTDKKEEKAAASTKDTASRLKSSLTSARTKKKENINPETGEVIDVSAPEASEPQSENSAPHAAPPTSSGEIVCPKVMEDGRNPLVEKSDCERCASRGGCPVWEEKDF